MKRFLQIIISSIVLFQLVQGQDPKIDSLRSIWNNNQLPDSVRFECGMDLFMIKFRTNLDTARTFGMELIEFAGNRDSLLWEATATRLVGNTYAIQGKYQQALETFTKSHQLLKSTDDEISKATTLSNIGTVHYELGNYTEALKNLLKALSVYARFEDKPGLSRVTNNIGNVYLRQKNDEKALEYYTYSLSIKEELNLKNTLPSAYNNIALVYSNLEQFDKALENMMTSAELAREIGDQRAYTRAYSNIGDIYNRLGQYNEALEYLNSSIRSKLELQDNDGLAAAYLYRGQSYLFLTNYQRARNDCKRSLDLGRTMGAAMLVKEACACLSKAYEGLGDPKTALAYFKQSVITGDSLINREKTEEITRQEMRYEFEKQQLADSIAYHKERAEQELAFEKDLNSQRNKFNIIVFGGLALLIIAGIYWRSRQKDKKLQRERAMVSRLKQIDQLKDQFLANTSHELRTPLNGIIGITESLKDGAAGKLPKPAIENLDLIVNSGKRLSNLVNDILDFSKLKNKDLDLNIKPTDIHAVSDIVVKLLSPAANEKSIELINSIPTDVALVEADENRLQQILYNLIGNAIKFTGKGRVEIRSKVSGRDMVIEVADTGIGIPEDKFEDIFNSFEQADGSDIREYGGTGLGLSVSRQLVELHGGTIRVNSTLGKGSVFSFNLPISSQKRSLETKTAKNEETVQRLSDEKNREETASEVKKATRSHRYKILVVDDERINRKVLENHLTIAGYDIVEARSGDEALNVLSNADPFDLILLDIMMPGISGFEVCEKIRKTYTASELPVIMLTAKNRVSDLVNGFNSGANDYLTKPFSKNELLSRIKTHLNLKGIHKATSKFVPSEFLKSVGRERITEVVLGDHVEKKVTVLFSDIREYTHLAEGMTPRQNFKFVNSYVGKMGPIIQEHKGFVNQYLGDGIMALFPINAKDALQAAIDMQLAVRVYNERRIREGYEPISIGIGLHTGPLVMGIIGDIHRNDTAIIADTVNTASRMEGVTKYYGTRIILSEDSWDQIEEKDRYNVRYLGKVKVKGKDQIVGIYECFDSDPPEDLQSKKETLPWFQAGLKHFFNNDFTKAQAEFQKIIDHHKQDKVAHYFLRKSRDFAENGIPADKNIANIMDQK